MNRAGDICEACTTAAPDRRPNPQLAEIALAVFSNGGGAPVYAMRRTDGEDIGDDIQWFSVSGPNDWQAATEIADTTLQAGDDPLEFEIAVLVPVARRRYLPPSWCGHGHKGDVH